MEPVTVKAGSPLATPFLDPDRGNSIGGATTNWGRFLKFLHDCAEFCCCLWLWRRLFCRPPSDGSDDLEENIDPSVDTRWDDSAWSTAAPDSVRIVRGGAVPDHQKSSDDDENAEVPSGIEARQLPSTAVNVTIESPQTAPSATFSARSISGRGEKGSKIAPDFAKFSHVATDGGSSRAEGELLEANSEHGDERGGSSSSMQFLPVCESGGMGDIKLGGRGMMFESPGKVAVALTTHMLDEKNESNEARDGRLELVEKIIALNETGSADGLMLGPGAAGYSSSQSPVTLSMIACPSSIGARDSANASSRESSPSTTVQEFSPTDFRSVQATRGSGENYLNLTDTSAELTGAAAVAEETPRADDRGSSSPPSAGAAAARGEISAFAAAGKDEGEQKEGETTLPAKEAVNTNASTAAGAAAGRGRGNRGRGRGRGRGGRGRGGRGGGNHQR